MENLFNCHISFFFVDVLFYIVKSLQLLRTLNGALQDLHRALRQFFLEPKPYSLEPLAQYRAALRGRPYGGLCDRVTDTQNLLIKKGGDRQLLRHPVQPWFHQGHQE